MGHMRGTAALHKAKSEPEIEARVAAVAIQVMYASNLGA